MVPDTRPNNPPRLGPYAMRPRTRVRRETYSSVRVRECNTHVDTCERAPFARARVGYPRQPARRPARAELTPPPSPSHRTRLSRRRDARVKTSYLLVSTTLLSHVALRALGFENLRACGRDHDDARARAWLVSLSDVAHASSARARSFDGAWCSRRRRRAYLSRRPRRGLRQTNSFVGAGGGVTSNVVRGRPKHWSGSTNREQARDGTRQTNWEKKTERPPRTSSTVDDATGRGACSTRHGGWRR